MITLENPLAGAASKSLKSTLIIRLSVADSCILVLKWLKNRFVEGQRLDHVAGLLEIRNRRGLGLIPGTAIGYQKYCKNFVQSVLGYNPGPCLLLGGLEAAWMFLVQRKCHMAEMKGVGSLLLGEEGIVLEGENCGEVECGFVKVECVIWERGAIVVGLVLSPVAGDLMVDSPLMRGMVILPATVREVAVVVGSASGLMMKGDSQHYREKRKRRVCLRDEKSLCCEGDYKEISSSASLVIVNLRVFGPGLNPFSPYNLGNHSSR
ncbi:hypothetical protein M9H77_25459 [Catharanthus roseus]|uniref:Uncharacterized protein n=1 Tax=Catharanthus roseus TaxID=4058 RepID=A0ACC0A7C2_CATRO|nr:hypothetical protein M9H77_25459 [Catharanthus roseus]